MKLLTLLLILISILSCTVESIKDESSYRYSIKAGSILVLNENIIIRSNTGRSFFQNGLITLEKNINIYYPHCSLTVNTLHKIDRTIYPTKFTIIKVIDDEEYAQGYILNASTDKQLTSDGPLITGLVSYYYLKSSSEPDVRTLECIQWNSIYENRHLNISEIRKSLGDIFTLNLIN